MTMTDMTKEEIIERGNAVLDAMDARFRTDCADCGQEYGHSTGCPSAPTLTCPDCGREMAYRRRFLNTDTGPARWVTFKCDGWDKATRSVVGCGKELLSLWGK